MQLFPNGMRMHVIAGGIVISWLYLKNDSAALDELEDFNDLQDYDILADFNVDFIYTNRYHTNDLLQFVHFNSYSQGFGFSRHTVYLW